MVWCDVVWYGMMWCRAVRCGVVRWSGVVVWCCLVWCGMVRYGAVWCGRARQTRCLAYGDHPNSMLELYASVHFTLTATATTTATATATATAIICKTLLRHLSCTEYPTVYLYKLTSIWSPQAWPSLSLR